MEPGNLTTTFTLAVTQQQQQFIQLQVQILRVVLGTNTLAITVVPNQQ